MLSRPLRNIRHGLHHAGTSRLRRRFKNQFSLIALGRLRKRADCEDEFEIIHLDPLNRQV